MVEITQLNELYKSPVSTARSHKSSDDFPLVSLTQSNDFEDKSNQKQKPTFRRKNVLKTVTKTKKATTITSTSNYKRISDIHGYLSTMEIRQLLKETNYSRRELYIMYVRFKALCSMSPTPYGIDRKTFKSAVARLSVEDDLFVNKVYDLIDEDHSDSIEWNEFLTVMSALEKGNSSKQNKKSQIQFFFRIYDIDNDGVISRKDLSTMFLSSAMLPKNDQTTIELTDAFVRKVFNVVTGNENGDHLTEDDVFNYLNGEGSNEDVWDLFGRSMLKDFTTRQNS